MCANETTPSNLDAVKTSGIHHLGLTVPNIKQTADFFINEMSFSKVGEKPDYPAIFVSDGTVMLTLWQVKTSNKEVDFDRHKNIGLHHFALKIETKEQLLQIHEQFVSSKNVEIEFEPEQLGDSDMYHMMCFIPGGIRLELICG